MEVVKFYKCHQTFASNLLGLRLRVRDLHLKLTLRCISSYWSSLNENLVKALRL